MPTRNIVLTDHQAAMIDRLVKSGQYQNASEVLREGLRLIERREAEEEARLAALRNAVNLGATDIETGRFHTFTEGSGLREHLESLAGAPTSRRRA